MHQLRTAALTGTILAALIGSPAFAQSTTPASGTQASEPAEAAPTGADVATPADQQNDVIVTGTRVEGRTRLDSISPVDVLSGASLQRQGTTELEAGGRVHKPGAGQAVGEMALFSKKKRTATVTAGGPVEALRIPAERFHDFLLQNPSVAVGILEQVVERLREVQDRVEAWYS